MWLIAIAVIIGFLSSFSRCTPRTGAHARDRYPQVNGASKLAIVSVVLRDEPLCWLCRAAAGRRDFVYGEGTLSQKKFPTLYPGHERGLGRQGRSHCIRRFGLRFDLSGLDGRSQRPHRRTGIRVIRARFLNLLCVGFPSNKIDSHGQQCRRQVDRRAATPPAKSHRPGSGLCSTGEPPRIRPADRCIQHAEFRNDPVSNLPAIGN